MTARKIKIKNPKLLLAPLKEAHVELAYLFGSTIQGDSIRGSDVDLAILLPRNTDLHGRFNTRLGLIATLSKLYSKEFDVVVLNDVPSLIFKHLIISQGRPVYRCDETTQALFESKVLAEYFDFRPCIDQFNAAYVAKNS